MSSFEQKFKELTAITTSCPDCIRYARFGYSKGLAVAIEKVKNFDPLNVVANWEDSDDIAYAIKQAILDSLPNKRKR